MSCSETHDRDFNASINLYFIGIEQLEVTPWEQALVDDGSSYGLPKSHPATKQEAQPFTIEQSASYLKHFIFHKNSILFLSYHISFHKICKL